MLRSFRTRLEATRKAALFASFQPDIVEIDRAQVPWMVRALVPILSGLVVVLVVWASLAKMDVVVRSRGRLISAQPTEVVQALETSVIRDLKVRANDVVTKGQPLVVLDPTFTEADVADLGRQAAARAVRRERLTAELQGMAFTAGPDADEERRLQALVFDERAKQFAARSQQLEQRMAQIQTALAGKRREVGTLDNQLSMASEISGIRNQLLRSGYGSKVNALQAQQARLDAERARDSARSSINELTHQLESARAERDGFINEWRRNAADELATTETELGQARERLSKAQRRRDFVILTAPSDGTVVEVAHRSAGSVVREAEMLVLLVPKSAKLEAEALIDIKDIGFVHEGDPVRVKLDAFPFERHGAVDGKVVSVGEDTLEGTPEMGVTPTAEKTRYFLARVELEPPQLRNLPRRLRLTSGITLTADIAVGRRRVISYFLDPLVKGLDQALSER